MTALNKHFHRAQSRLKNGSPLAKGNPVVRPLFQPELVGIDTKDNLRRVYEYRQKLAAMEAARCTQNPVRSTAGTTSTAMSSNALPQ